MVSRASPSPTLLASVRPHPQLIPRILYSLLWYLAAPLVGLRLLWRSRRQPEYLQHVGERLGRYSVLSSRSPIWVHAVSVGETRAAAPIVHALLDAYPEDILLLTHMTPTGRATAAEIFGDVADRVVSVYLPYDFPWAVRRFLEHFRPRVGILMETELWPNLLAAAHSAGIPVAMINARLSERSAGGYARIGPLARSAFASLSAVGAQSEADAHRLSRLGARYLVVTGNIKFDIGAPTAMLNLGAEFRNGFGPRRVLLAASTREGEESPLLEAFARLCPEDVLLVLVPRHPQRFDEVAERVRRAGLKMQRRSSGEPVMADTRVWLGDSMGEMFAYYSAADAALIGGGWKPLGGQNPIESAAVGCPAIVGPHTFNFATVCRQAVEAGAALRANSLDEGIQAALDILDKPELRRQMSEAGRQFAQAHRGATERTLDLLAPLLKTAPVLHRRSRT